jgi:hypothetical protein
MNSSASTEYPYHPVPRRRITANHLINTYRQRDSQSGGMGYPHSQLIQKVSSHRPSIVDRLGARSITAQSLQILVHQHCGYRIHFEWNGGSRSMVKSLFMERKFFMYTDAQTFCIELCKKGLEGICSCVYGDYHTYIPAKTPRCFRWPFYPSQKYFQKPRWWVKSLEEGEPENLCDCKITSTDSIPDWS